MMKTNRGGQRIAHVRARRSRGGTIRGRGGHGGHTSCPNFNDAPNISFAEMDFTEDIQMSGLNYQHWDNNFDRKRSAPPFAENQAKKPRMDGSNSLLPTPSRPAMRGVPHMGGHFPPHPPRAGFCPSIPQDMPYVPPARFFGPGPRGAPRPMGPPPRGPARFPHPHFNRPGPPGPLPPPIGFRSAYPHPHRGLPLPRGGPYPNRGFGGAPRMFRP